MVADTDTLEVLNNLPRCHLCVKGKWLAHIGIPRLFKCVNDEASCFPLCRLEYVPVGDAGAMYGFGFGVYYTGRAIGDQFLYISGRFGRGNGATNILL